LVAGTVWWLAALLLGGDEARAWRGLLTSFLFFTPMSAGLVTWSATVLLSRGRWTGYYERLAAAGASFALPSVLVLGALWLGSAEWAPWIGRELPQSAWLSRPFLFVRDLVGLMAFWIAAGVYVTRRIRCGGTTAAVVLVLAYAVVFSLLGFDLVMGSVISGTEPLAWKSEMIGGYLFVSGLYAAVAAWALQAVFQPDANLDRLHDFGKLIVAFAMLTTYLMYSQLLPIWYENLPAETLILAPRMNIPAWKWISFGLLGTVYLGPVAFLLLVRAKRSRVWLGAVCLVVLAGLWVERWWLLAPQFDAVPRLGSPELSAGLALLGAFGLGLELFKRRLPLLLPLEDVTR
jgi:hypothetical protein